jgi:predicted acyl esterase
MLSEEMIFKPAYEYKDDGIEHGVLSKFNPRETILKAGTQLHPATSPLKHDIKYLQDVGVKMRDGITIYVDIFLPPNLKPDEKVPVLIAWSPYGKTAGTAPRYINLFNMLGMGNKWSSGLTKFEGPDPDYWCWKGYAICNPDPRGIARSEGNITMIGSQEANDCYDLIEWLAVQDWCNGKTALTGTSYLTFSQWFIAATQPPHLTCIAPHEGLQDAYRDIAFVGGIPDPNFLNRLQVNHVSSTKGVLREDMIEEMKKYPLANAELWKDKCADCKKIKIPVFVSASYSNTLHTMGTFRAWRGISSEKKWLRIHDTQEWPDYYDEKNTEERCKFFDYFLKEIENGWEKTPKVRYCLLDLEGGNKLNIKAEEFPPKNVIYKKFYFNALTRLLINDPPLEDKLLRYSPDGLPVRTSFQVTFDDETSFLGYPKVKLFMECEGYDDMDVFVWIQKIDKRGNVLSEFVVPNHGAALQDFTQDGASTLRYKGSIGKLRSSMRHLDPEKSTDIIPYYTFDRIEKLTKGQIVELDIKLSPIGLTYYKDETLRIMISSHDEIGSIMPGTPGCIPDNKGTHILHTGGKYASYLQIPFLK